MDPNATLRKLLQALVDGERDDAIEAMDDLTTWIRKGGFLPEMLYGNCWIGSANREIWRIKS